jgi:hypothetical protein
MYIYIYICIYIHMYIYIIIHIAFLLVRLSELNSFSSVHPFLYFYFLILLIYLRIPTTSALLCTYGPILLLPLSYSFGLIPGTRVPYFVFLLNRCASLIAFHPNCCNSGSLRMSNIAGQIPCTYMYTYMYIYTYICIYVCT